MPGPPPKPPGQRRRRNANPGETLLPAAGREGKPPPWPLPGKKLAGEAAIWAELWKTPQSVAWERLGWTRVVARYARGLVAAEKPYALPPLLGEIRQLEDRLGLTPMAMRRLMWKVDDRDEVAQRGPERKPAAKRRLKVVDTDAVAGA